MFVFSKCCACVQDKAVAENGGRVRNIKKVSDECTKMINVRQC